MNDGELLLRSICEAPDEDTPRLMYADWLDENGQPERAAFIRVQVQLAKVEAPVCEDPVVYSDPDDVWWVGRQKAKRCERCDACRYAARAEKAAKPLRDRERELWDAADHNKVAWRWGLGGNFRHTIRVGPGASLPAFRDRPDCCALFTRGFVGEVNCRANLWIAEGDAILAAHPVRRVTLTTLDAGLLLGRSLLVQLVGGVNEWECDRYPDVVFAVPDPAPAPTPAYHPTGV
jgi:uncharacterized protein (TIGR02996 family)